MKPVRVVMAASLVALTVSVGVSRAGASSPSSFRTPVVDDAVQVTNNPDPARGFVEPTVANDPRKPSTLALLAGDATSGACSVYTSTNAGLSWTKAAGAFAPKDYPKCVWVNLGSFAALTFGPDGSVNIAFTGQPLGDWHSRAFFARSSDLGLTWTTTELPKQATDYAHRRVGSVAVSDVVVDPSDPNRVYVGYWSDYNNWIHESELPVPAGMDNFTAFPGRAMVAASTDGGKTFRDPVDVHDVYNAWLTEPHMAIGTKGEVFVIYGDDIEKDHKGGDWTYPTPPLGHVWMASSTDGGKSYSKAQVLYSRGPASGWGWTQSAIPVVDHNNGNVYVAWEATGPGPDGGEKTTGPAAVKFLRSTDAGKTWSKPIQVNDVVPARNWDCCTYEPRMSIAPDGRLDVAFYDPRQDPAFDPVKMKDRFYDVFYSFSTDGGITWSKNVKVSDRSIDRSFGPSSSNYGIKGPLGITSTNTGAFITWDETRNGSDANPNQDIYFTRARFSDAVIEASGATASSSHPLAWGIGGAAIAFGLGGVAMLVLARRRKRSG